MEEKNKFINLQLFGEDGDGTDNDASNPSKDIAKEEEKPEPKQPEEKRVSKDLFDKTANELSQLKKKLKELEDKDKTNEQKAQDFLAELEQAKLDKQRELDELTVKFNKSNAIAALSELKGKLSLSEKDTELEELVSHLVELDGDKTKSKISTFKGLIEKVYTKGFETAKQGGWSSMSNQKSNSSTSKKSGFAEFQEQENKKNETNKIDFK